MPSLNHHTSVQGPTRVGAAGEITVESSSSGIEYDVTCRLAGSSQWFTYRTQCVRSAPVHLEPAPDPLVRFSECVGMLRLRFVDGVGNPVTVDGASAIARPLQEGPCGDAHSSARVQAGATELVLLLRGDDTYSVMTHFKSGTDPYHDELSYEDVRTIHVGCDQVLDEVITCFGGGDGGGPGGPGGGESGLGRVVGIADVLGVDENPEPRAGDAGYSRTSIIASTGPWGNGRTDRVVSTPASGPFELENLMPSDVTVPSKAYGLRVNFSLGAGDRLQNLTQESQVMVPTGTTVDIGGRFEIDPGRVRGDILLVGPPGLGAPTVPALSLLEQLGPAPAGWGSLGGVSYVEALIDGGATPLREPKAAFSRSASAGFVGGFDPVSAGFSGDYEMIVGGLDRGPSDCSIGRLKLRLSSDPGAPALSNVSTYVALADLAVPVTIPPGAVVVHPIHACFGQLFVSFLSTSAPFTDPGLRTSFSDDGCTWHGVDFEGRPVHRRVALDAEGTPNDGNAAQNGMVVTTLPEGDYTLHPEVTTVNPGGGTSLTRMLPIDLSVGCREIVTIYPDFLMEASGLPPCTQPGSAMIEGQVRGGADVARITCQVNADPPQTWCAPCGVDPAFAIPVALGGGDVSVVVSAETADGRITSRRSFSREAVEPSALDLRPASTPLRLSRAGGAVELTWEDDGAHGVNAYMGTLASLHDARSYDHAGLGACDLSGGRLTTTPPAGAVYFLVGTSCGWGDSSLGRDFFGRERPPALHRCL